ncbi:hypothetical protein ACB098_01G243100 [Castanea mollissima]
MMSSLCGSMGSLKRESSSTKLPPTSSIESVSESKKTFTTTLSNELGLNSLSLTPTCLDFPTLKFELDGDIESFFSDQLDGDFMISSPVRNLQSPQTSTYNYNYNYAQAMQGQSLSGCSPPRLLSQIGPFRSTNKGKGLSPLHRVFNSPKNHSSHCFDIPNIVPAVDGLTISNNSSRFCGSVSETSSLGGSQLTQESNTYQMSGSIASGPLSELLQQDRHQDNQLQQKQTQQQEHYHHNLNHSLMEQDSGLQLVHFLLACAEAVTKEDYMLARRYVLHLNRVVSPLGDSMQRVAACFTEALSARLAATLTTKPSTSSSKVLKIYQIVYQACPYIKFAHFTANQAIFEAFEAEERVHVIDLDILQGYQWPAFMQALAARPGGAPFLRITGVGSSIESVRETGKCLTELPHSLHIPFEFHPVGEQLEDLKPHMFNRRVGEALAVNSVNRLHRVPSNSLGNLLAMIRDQAPNIVTQVEQEASHNGPYFLGRFLEALHYYSAIFDSLDAMFTPESAQRAKVEQYIFAPEIRNIVAFEGPERTERHERLEKWRKIMEGKGFKGVPLSANAVTQSKILLGLYSCDGYRLTEDKGCKRLPPEMWFPVPDGVATLGQ